MATQNLRIGGSAANVQPRAFGRRAGGNPSCNYMQIDASAGTVPALDVLQIFDVPAGSIVTIVPDVETAEGGVATADLGWTEDPNGFADALDLNVATTNTAPAAPVTKFFAAASIVTLTLDHELDTAVLGFYISVQTV